MASTAMKRQFINMSLFSSGEDTDMSMADSSGREVVVEQTGDKDKENREPCQHSVKECQVKLKKLKYDNTSLPIVVTSTTPILKSINNTNTSSRDGSINTSSRDGSINTSSRDGSINTSSRDGSINTSSRDVSIPSPSPAIDPNKLFSISPTTPISPPNLSSTPYPSPTLSNVSMVPPVGGRGVSPPASPVPTRAQQQVEAANMGESDKQEDDEKNEVGDGHVKEVVAETVKNECVQQDGDKEDLEVNSVECLNSKCQVTIIELKEKLAKSKRLMLKHEKMLQLEQEHVHVLNEKIKLLKEENE